MKPYRPISSVNTAATRKKSIKCTKVSIYFFFRERHKGKEKGRKKKGGFQYRWTVSGTTLTVFATSGYLSKRGRL